MISCRCYTERRTTAYKDYALQAFQTWAIDYLLKPFDENQLTAAIEKYKSIIADQNNVPTTDWDKLSEMFYAAKERKSISIKQANKIKLIDLDKISYVTAEDKYCKIYLSNGTNMFCDMLLKEVSDKLNHSFLRIHRSTIINAAHISEITKSFKSRYTFHFIDSNLPSVRSGGSYAPEIRERLAL